MSIQSFKLRPFSSPLHFGLDFQVQLQITAAELQFTFRLIGDANQLERLVWPEISKTPQRCDGLWQSTCFELFLGNTGEAGYFEFNFSPSQDWNAYQFTAERQGMRVAEALRVNPLKRVARAPGVYEMEGVIELQSLEVRADSLELSATAVLNWGGQNEYWAIRHEGHKPDFHLRSSFVKSVV